MLIKRSILVGNHLDSSCTATEVLHCACGEGGGAHTNGFLVQVKVTGDIFSKGASGNWSSLCNMHLLEHKQCVNAVNVHLLSLFI